jgi:hypothetical protein
MSPEDNESDATSIPETRYGTRWGVFGAVLAPTLLTVATLGALVAKGALALSFVAQSGTLDLATPGLTGTGLGVVVADLPSTGGHSPIARIGVGAGHINGLCLAEHVAVLGQPLTVLITGGDADPASYEIAADGLVLDLTSVTGVVNAGGTLQINKSAADVTTNAPGVALNGAANRFGLQASTVQLRNVRATVRDIVIPHLLDVPGFRVQVVAGSQTCP